MPDQKRDETSNLILNIIVLICFVTCCMLYTVGLETLAQESAQRESSLTASKIEIKGFLDSNYGRLPDARIFSEQEIQIHPFSAYGEQCNTCHEIKKTAGADASYIIFRENSTDLLTAACIKCHPQGAADHPIKITPSFPIPKDLPLSEKKEITCITCHNPHFRRFSNRSWLPRTFLLEMIDFINRKKQYKTYFLRRNNAKKELCLACHQGLRHQWGFFYQPKKD